MSRGISARGKLTSITRRVRSSVWSVALILAIPVVIGLVMMLLYSNRYQAMIRRMDAAAELKPIVKSQLAEDLFSVAAGRVSYEDSRVDWTMGKVNETLDDLLAETDQAGHMQLLIARRTMGTVEEYSHKVRDGMAEHKPVTEVEQIVDEVRDVGALVGDMLDAFIAEEIANANETSTRLQRVLIAVAIVEIFLLLAALIRTSSVTRSLTGDIQAALGSLENTVRRIAEGNFGDRVTGMEVDELQELGDQINQMAAQLETLIDQISQKEQHLAKAELRTMQAQINPHFLYNTLDTIVWQAESGKADEVVRLTRSLSDFFRISLSSGADWIPVKQELKHVRAYLSIQKTRYRDILDYEVDEGEDTEDVYMVKLLLQPLVENALYHGIKLKRGGGRIEVRLRMHKGLMTFLVRDTGKGMTPERLKELTDQLEEEYPLVPAPPEGENHGFGLRNVDMRIKLYYGKKRGLILHSGAEGTEVTFTIPVRTREEISHDESVSG